MNFIRSIFGLNQPQRTASEQPKSKIKLLTEKTPDRPPSLDSKEKHLQKTQSKKNISPEEFFELDEVGTVKCSKQTIYKDNIFRQNVNLDMISDLNEEKDSIDQDDDLLADLPNDCYSVQVRPIEFQQKYNYKGYFRNSDFTFGPERKQSKRQDVKMEIQTPHGRSELMKEKMKPRAARMLPKRPFPNRIMKARLQCPFCYLPLEIESSSKLACSHRFHDKCALKMRERNRFECDLCEIKRQNMGSMVLLDRKRQRNYSPFNPQ